MSLTTLSRLENESRAQELCESQGEGPGLPVPNSPYGLCGRKATLEEENKLTVIQRL